MNYRVRYPFEVNGRLLKKGAIVSSRQLGSRLGSWLRLGFIEKKGK